FFSKPGCQICVSLKKKLIENLKVPFAERNIEHVMALHDGWREDGGVAARAGHEAIHQKVPLMMIDGRPFDYVKGLLEIKTRLAEGEEATMPDLPAQDDPDLPLPDFTEDEFISTVQKLCPKLDGICITCSRKRQKTFPGNYDETTLSGFEVKINGRLFNPLWSFRFWAKGTLREIARELERQYMKESEPRRKDAGL
ncbi:hypothetical protein LCGC14_1405200, partial [marine sediment metagenome]